MSWYGYAMIWFISGSEGRRAQMVRTGPVIALIAQLALLALLAGTVGLSALGWLVGIGYGLVMNASLAAGLARSDATILARPTR